MTIEGERIPDQVGGDILGDLFGRVDAMIAADEAGNAQAVALAAAGQPAPVTPTPAPKAAPAPEPEIKAAPIAAPAPDPAADRSIARIAAREAAVAEAEKAVKEAQARTHNLQSQLRRDPIAALKAMGIEENEVGTIVRVAMGSLLPQDKVPAQYKDMKERLTMEDRFRTLEAQNEALRSQLTERDQVSAQSAAISEYAAGVDKYLGDETGAKSVAPNLHLMFASKPQMAREKILAVVQKDAAAKIEAAKRGEDVRAMTPAEAAAVVEAELAEYATLFGASVNKTSTTAATTTAVQPSLTNRATQTTATQAVDSRGYVEPVDAVDAWLKSKGL